MLSHRVSCDDQRTKGLRFQRSVLEDFLAYAYPFACEVGTVVQLCLVKTSRSQDLGAAFAGSWLAEWSPLAASEADAAPEGRWGATLLPTASSQVSSLTSGQGGRSWGLRRANPHFQAARCEINSLRRHLCLDGSARIYAHLAHRVYDWIRMISYQMQAVS